MSSLVQYYVVLVLVLATNKTQAVVLDACMVFHSRERPGRLHIALMPLAGLLFQSLRLTLPGHDILFYSACLLYILCTPYTLLYSLYLYSV